MAAVVGCGGGSARFYPVADPASRSLGTNPPLEPSATHLGATILSLRSSAGQTQGLRLLAVTLAAVKEKAGR